MKSSHQGKILAASLLVAVGTLGYMAKTELERASTPAPYVMPIEQGQATLDELVKDPRLENFGDVVEEVVYDPGFVKCEGVLRSIVQDPATGNSRLIAATQRALQQLISAREGNSLSYAARVPENVKKPTKTAVAIFLKMDFKKPIERRVVLSLF